MTATIPTQLVPVSGRALRVAAEWLLEVAGSDLDQGAAVAAADALIRHAHSCLQQEPVAGLTLAGAYQAAISSLTYGPDHPGLSADQRAAAVDALSHQVDQLNYEDVL